MTQTEAPLNTLEVLDGIAFPVTLVEMVDYAQEHDASEETLDMIQAMPDRVYRNIHDISMHLGEIEALPSQENQWPSAPTEELQDPDALEKRDMAQLGMQERSF